MFGVFLKVINDYNIEYRLNRMSEYLQVDVNEKSGELLNDKQYIDNEWYIVISEPDDYCFNCILNRNYIKNIGKPRKIIRWYIKIKNKDGTSNKVVAKN